MTECLKNRWSIPPQMARIVCVLLVLAATPGLARSAWAQAPSILNPPSPIQPPSQPGTKEAPAAPPLTLSPPETTPAEPAPATGPPAPVLTGRIAQIIIQGNVNVSKPAIRAVLSQKIGDLYSPAAAEKDRDAVKGMGYFNGDVALGAVADPAGGVDVSYTVVENPVVKRIAFTANTPSGEPTIPGDRLRSLMDTKEGLVLNTNTLFHDLDRLFNSANSFSRQQGYIFNVSPDINIDPTNGVLTIPLIEAYIQGIQVKGNKQTRAVVVTRELHSHPGDILDEKKLQRDLTRVYNLGLFDQVGPYDLIPTDVGKVIVSIPVTERRSGTVGVAIGYSSRAKVFGRAELAQNNFRGLGERVSLQWEVGGISSQSSLELGFFEPYLDKEHTSLDLDLYDKVIYRFSSSTFGGTIGSDNTYTERRQGLVTSVNRPLSDTLIGSLSERSESVRTNDVQVPFEDTFIRQDGTVNALGGRLSSNTRDTDFTPAAGALRIISYEAGMANTRTVGRSPSPLAPGRHALSKLGLDLRQYISLQGPRKPGNFREPKKVLAVRLLMGFANRDIPFFEQYFLGGADSLRGYQTDRYWGNKLALLQSELRLPVGKGDNFQGVLLADVGDAWGSLYQGQGLQQHQNMSLSSDYGVGVRLVTPIGPIRLDYAFGRDGGRTQFSIGQSF